jgi:hypothetical protein
LPGADVNKVAEHAWSAIEAAIALVMRVEAGEPILSFVSAEPLPAETAPGLDLASLVSAAGWPFTVRSPSRLAIPLDVPGLSIQAALEVVQAGDVRARVQLEPSATSLSPDSREGIAQLLLTTSGLVRLSRARSEATFEGAGSGVGFEADLRCLAPGVARQPGAEELDLALLSLTVAARLCAREVKALADETVARLYLVSSRRRQRRGSPGLRQRRGQALGPLQEADHATR